MDTTAQLVQIALSIFLAALRASTENDGGFKMLITTTVDGTAKPLLLVGSAHGGIEDGHIIAILNPDEALCDRIKACCGYSHGILTEIVAKRCDMMVHVGISAYMAKQVRTVTKYVAKVPQPAKFLVR